MKSLFNFFACLFGLHTWTTPFLERECELDQDQIKIFGFEKSFKMDNRMYCKHCYKESNLNRE